MAIVDFTPINLDLRLDLQGNVTMTDGKKPIVFLFAEKHNDNNVIGQNIQNALALFDARAVEIVGVEQYSPLVDIKAEISKERSVIKDGGIEGFGRALISQLGGSEATVIEKIRSTPCPKNQQGLGFARHLLFLRPTISIVGVEDPDLKRQADENSSRTATMFRDEKEQIAELRKLNHDIDLKRDAAFLENVDKAYQRRACGNSIIINGGGLHMNRLEDSLKRAGRAVVLVVPEGYGSALDQ